MPSACRDDIERQFSSISGQWAPHGTGGLKSGNFIQKFPPAAPSLRNANACLLLGLKRACQAMNRSARNGQIDVRRQAVRDLPNGGAWKGILCHLPTGDGLRILKRVGKSPVLSSPNSCKTLSMNLSTFDLSVYSSSYRDAGDRSRSGTKDRMAFNLNSRNRSRPLM